MESDLWNLLSELLTRTAGHGVNSEIGKVRSVIPEANVQLQNMITLLDSRLHYLDEKYRQEIITRVIGDIYVHVEHIWHYSASCLRICFGGECSNESVVTACRVALQQSWYADSGPPTFSRNDSTKSNASSRPVIYLSPAAPLHLRRWLSLNICCSDLLITVLPTEDGNVLPTISVSCFERIVQNDLRLGRQPLLLVAYVGSISTGSFDCLPTLSRICHRHRMWLHVEGLTFLHMALLANPSANPTGSMVAMMINSINLELSRCLGLPRSLSVLLMHSSLPESILHYLNILPLSMTTATVSADTPSILLPSACLSDALLAWFSLRTQDNSHVDRLKKACHLTAYALKQLRLLGSIELFSSHPPPPITTSTDDSDGDSAFIQTLYANSVHCPIILFRYVLSLSQRAGFSAQTKSTPVLRANATNRVRFMSESSVPCVEEDEERLLDLRFLNSLNLWLASALQLENPNLVIRTHVLLDRTLVLRFSPLEFANLITITDHDIDTWIGNIKINSTIMAATWQSKVHFRELINSTPGLYYYDLPDWAGLGAAFYVPHTYRCLLPDSGDISLQDYQNRLVAALLRLHAKAAHHICDLNRELISRLRNQDYAFSSAPVTFNTVPAVLEALESLASKPTVFRSMSLDATLVNTMGGEGGGWEGRLEGAIAPIRQAQLLCLRFGLITPGTDISEIIQTVLRMANAVEEDSYYVENLSEVVKKGIEEATLHMNQERTQIMREQGVLRQLPYLNKLIDWWSPPVSTQIHGQMLNLSLGELVPTAYTLPGSSPSTLQRSQPTDDPSASSSIWSWLFPFVGVFTPMPSSSTSS